MLDFKAPYFSLQYNIQTYVSFWVAIVGALSANLRKINQTKDNDFVFLLLDLFINLEVLVFFLKYCCFHYHHIVLVYSILNVHLVIFV